MVDKLKSVLNAYQTPITDEFLVAQLQDHNPQSCLLARDELSEFCRALERDCINFALRLYGENPDTFAPETAEVMDRWRPRAKALLDVSAK